MSGEIERLVHEAIASFGDRCELLPCDPEYADTVLFCERYGYQLEDSANTIIVAGRREPIDYVACVVLADSRLDVNKTVRKLMGVRKLSFATAEQTEALTGMMIGGVTVFGLPPGLRLYVDSRVMSRPFVILGGGSRSWKVRADPSVLEDLPDAEVIDGLSMPAR